MELFFIGLFLLILGYFFYGKVVERVLGPDDRVTPAVSCADGVDYVVLPKWKNMLIQLLNIAGVGPVIGVIYGIKFGAITFLIIPIGNILGGAVHDYIAGMMSLRYKGANLPSLIQRMMGPGFSVFFSIFTCFLLLLVVAVFINIPANLIVGMIPAGTGAFSTAGWFWIAVAVIFLYYIMATLFPVDKIIGSIYPLFGALLLVGTCSLLIMLLCCCIQEPALLEESAAFRAGMFTPEKSMPILPMLFVTIACGIMSGFHATQSPIIARTMRSEREARSSYYGMMVLEGFIAMVWAAGGLAIYNMFPQLMKFPAAKVLSEITNTFLGSGVGAVTVISVVILSITSGDTAMRSLRLSLAELCRVPQKPFLSRVLLTLPLVIVVALLLWWANQGARSFQLLWNYFAWGNQVLAACTLIAGTVWLAARRRPVIVALLPGVFITFVIFTYILWISSAHSNGSPVVGLALELEHAYLVSAFLAAVIFIWAVQRGRQMRNPDEENGKK